MTRYLTAAETALILEALKDPEKRARIEEILKEAGLLKGKN